MNRKIKIKIEVKIPLPLRAFHGRRPKQERYQLQRRGKIARILKPKPSNKIEGENR